MNNTQKLIGTILEGGEERDAIHVAVLPVNAGEQLTPGEKVYLNEGRAYSLDMYEDPPLGIVDPFLPSPVKKGERFFIFLMPNTVEDMRHHWTHKDVPNKVRASAPLMEESEAWLRDFCQRYDTPRYEDVIAAINGTLPNCGPEYYSSWGYLDEEYFHFNGRDAHSGIPAEFWDHIENVTGRKIPPEKRATSFSCSC